MFGAAASVIKPDRDSPGIYNPRDSSASHYFRCVSAHWEDLERDWEDLYQRQYGFFRPYIIRAAFSQEWMRYVPASDSSDGQAKVIYQSKDGRERKVFFALDWLAQLTTHIPNRKEHMVRYYGYYSNKSRGQRIKAGQDNDIANIIDTGLSDKAFRKSWERLIQKIYEIDPLLCPKCQGQMKIIGFIEEQAVIKQILQHLCRWDIRNNGPPPAPLNIVREPVYLPVPDQAPAGDEVWSQVPNYGYWAD